MSAPVAPPPSSGRSPVWTPERLTLACRLWGEGVAIRDIRAEVNRLPGRPLASDEAFQMKRHQLGWPARRGVRGHAMPSSAASAPVVVPAAVELTPTQASDFTCVTGDRAEAEALIRKGLSGRAVAEELDLPLGDVARWVGELRDKGEIP